MTSSTVRAEQMPQDDSRCFGCGAENDHGLQLVFVPQEDGSVRGDTVLRNDFQGWKGVAHGGIVMMMLDEAMAHAAAARGHAAVTANIQVRFKKPTPLNVPIVLVATVEWERRAVLGMKAEVRDEQGKVLAFAQGEFLSRGSVENARANLS